MRLLRAADHRAMPWKNGGGTTSEIAVSPDGAGLDDFDWRVSMAQVDGQGPFSLFPGVDRTLLVLDGPGFRLDIEGRRPVFVMQNSEPLTFPADVATFGWLRGGPVLDLNVMVRRGTYDHSVRRLGLEEPHRLKMLADATLLFCDFGHAVVTQAERQVELAERDCLLLDRSTTPLNLIPQPEADLIIIELTRTL
jgi:environmental stress-induced protein Ves